MGTTFSMLILSATVSVDSFFVMSGLLLTWAMMKELDKRRKVNIPLMYFHRYLRLTPALAALLLLYVSLLRYIGSGPMWDADAQVAFCNKWWWTTLLYVQNYVNVREIVSIA